MCLLHQQQRSFELLLISSILTKAPLLPHITTHAYTSRLIDISLLKHISKVICGPQLNYISW